MIKQRKPMSLDEKYEYVEWVPYGHGFIQLVSDSESLLLRELERAGGEGKVLRARVMASGPGDHTTLKFA